MGRNHPLKLPHPRNIYRDKVNIKELALQYPELRNFVIQGLDGRVTMNFKDKEALSILSKVLLKKDFDLKIEIAPDRLVPTIPLRLNYLLWIEDLLECLPPKLKSSSDVYGIDIGTGASCIYALLAARKNGYHMLATEIDEINFNCAKQNVLNNNLENLVTVKHVNSSTYLHGAVNQETIYDFCMCNPPFFNSEDQNGQGNIGNSSSSPTIKTKNRTGHRMPPKNAPTGSIVELAVPGGEVAFIGNIINDSVHLKDKVRIYTTMVGHKTNVDKIVSQLIESQGINKEHLTVTAFHQGNVTRWGVAWTFIDDIKFPSDEREDVLKLNKKLVKPPAEYVLENTNLKDAIERLKLLLERISIKPKIIQEKNDEFVIEIKSYEETWKNQRKRRREEERRLKEESKKIKTGDTTNNENGSTVLSSPLVGENICDNNEGFNIVNQSEYNQSKDDNCCPRKCDDNSQSINSNKPLVLKSMILLKDIVEKSVVLRISPTGGTGGWEAVHQVLTYLKNHWNRNL